MILNLLLVLILSLFAPLASCMKIQVVGAGVSGGIKSWPAGPYLSTVATLCKSNIPTPFTLQCTPDKPSKSITFTVDGKVIRTEFNYPYVLTGNGDAANPWVGYASKTTVKCTSDSGESAQSVITFSCGESKISTVQKPPPAQTKRSWSPRGRCVVIPAHWNFVKTGAWRNSGGAMAYRDNDWSRSVDAAGRAELVYEFRAPVTSHYAFCIDMWTGGGVDHNDVWVQFPYGGWRLMKRGSYLHRNGWVKAYHNRNGRVCEAFSVDFNPHALSTAMLYGGKKYIVKVSGRSTRVYIHRVLFWPCYGNSCMDGYAWRGSRDVCLWK